MLVLLALAVLAALPVLATVVRRLAKGHPPGLIQPAAMLVAALSVLFMGGRHFENNWIGTGGHYALVPSGLAAFIWAVTFFATSWYAHPGLFATLQVDHRVWMTLSPFVLAAAVSSSALLVRRARISPRVARFEAWLGLLACVAMAVFVGGYCAWGAEQVRLPVGPQLGINVGLLNFVIAVVLVLVLAVAAQAARMAIVGLRPARS